MANLPFLDKNKLEKLFNMKTGYVLNFTNRKFREFVFDSTEKNIYDARYVSEGDSKASRLRSFWEKEADTIVGKLLRDLLNYCSEENPGIENDKLFRDCSQIAERLSGRRRKLKDTSSGLSEGKGRAVSKVERAKVPSHPQGVFVVHGRNTGARDSLFNFLRAIGLKPLEWSQAVELTSKTNPYIGEILDAAFDNAGAIVVLMTPDDEVRLRQPYRRLDEEVNECELRGQARPNVLFEAGMSMGRDPARTILVELGVLKSFSDIGGRHVLKLDSSPASRQQLAQRLKKAGCPVDLSGIDWHTAGDFKIETPPRIPSNKTTAVAPPGAKKRIYDELNNSRYKWRKLRTLADRVQISEEIIANLLRPDTTKVRFSKNKKSGDVIVGLRSRIG